MLTWQWWSLDLLVLAGVCSHGGCWAVIRSIKHHLASLRCPGVTWGVATSGDTTCRQYQHRWKTCLSPTTHCHLLSTKPCLYLHCRKYLLLMLKSLTGLNEIPTYCYYAGLCCSMCMIPIPTPKFTTAQKYLIFIFYAVCTLHNEILREIHHEPHS